MTGQPNDDVARVIQEFLDRRVKGEAPSKEEYLERHPELREALQQQFDTIEALDRLVVGKGPTPPRQATLGDFRILREIGRGGMGVVFLAEQSSLHRHVALKVLSQPLAQAYHHFERFRREAEIAARLHHPNLVAVYSVGESQGYPYFAMEYVRGVTLGQVLVQLRERAKTERLAEIDLASLVRELVPADIDDEDWDRETPRPARPTGYFAVVAGLLADLADGLDYAHGRGVIHRDVKPQNILLDRTLTPQLADFGLAKDIAHERLSITGDLLGTPYYMSPELAMAGRIKVDHRTDVYSLGVTLYELLTMRVPFSGSSSNEVLRKIVLEPVPFPRRVNPSVPRDLQVIALKAMEKDPDHRYASAAELAEDLRRFLRFDPITARPPGPLRIAARFVVRHRIAAAFGAVALVAGLGMAGTGMLAARSATVGEKLAHVHQLDESKKLKAACDEAAAILRDFGELKDVRSYLNELEKRRSEEIARVTLENDAYVLRANAGWRQAIHLTEITARTLEEDLGAKQVARVATMFGDGSLEISSDPPGARVTAMPLNEWTGEFGTPIEMGRTDVSESPASMKLEVGPYRIVVDGDAAGFAEHYFVIRSGSEARNVLHSVLRPTAQVIAEMVLVPAGRYRIGLDLEGFPAKFDSHLTSRTVEIPAFCIDRTEVTNRQYLEYLDALDAQLAKLDPRARKLSERPAQWRGAVPPKGEEDLPVRGVSWKSALAFAEWAGKRLPTEIEWEAACRGPAGSLYSWGDELEMDRANLAAPLPPPNQVTTGGIVRASPGSLEPAAGATRDQTPTGILHMIGNVKEWTQDPWVPRVGIRGRVWSYVASVERVVRGASNWTPKDPEMCTAARREARGDEYVSFDIGFRCAKSVRK